MNYDEIDQYVDKLFRQEQPSESHLSESHSSEWHVNRVDEMIQETYNDALWWHNNRISEGGDPRSGLRGLPYVPWDENIDGVAAMQGAIGGAAQGSYQRTGAAGMSAKRDGLTCGEAALIVAIVAGLLLFMALYGSLGEIVRLP